MKPAPKTMSWIARTRTGRKFVSSQRYRIILSAAAAFASNLLYAVYHGVLGVLNRSLWFIAMCAFYGILATMRFSAILCEGSHHLRSSDDTELFVMGFSGILLIILGIVLAAVNYISLSQNIAAKHEEIMMITIATYTFCKICNDSRESCKTAQKSLAAVTDNPKYQLCGGVCFGADFAAVHARLVWLCGSRADPHDERNDRSCCMFVCADAWFIHDNKIK